MSEQDILAHRAIAASMNMVELSSIIKQLHVEKDELKQYLTKAEIIKYDLTILIYSTELEHLLSLTNQNHSTLVH